MKEDKKRPAESELSPSAKSPKMDDKLIYKFNIACLNGEVETVRGLIEEINVNETYNRYPFINGACTNGHIEIVKLLLEYGADINKKGPNGYTPIHNACSNGYIEIVKLLLARGANPNISNKEGYMPIHSACSKGRTNIAELLLKHEINKSSAEKGYTPLHCAIRENKLDTVKSLLEYKGVDVNKGSVANYTPLHAAAYEHGVTKDTVKIGELLIKEGADVNATCGIYPESKEPIYFGTPLHFACKKNSTEWVELLLKQKEINPSIKDKDDNAPTYYAVGKIKERIGKVLEDKGAKQSKDLSSASSGTSGDMTPKTTDKLEYGVTELAHYETELGSESLLGALHELAMEDVLC